MILVGDYTNHDPLNLRFTSKEFNQSGLAVCGFGKKATVWESVDSRWVRNQDFVGRELSETEKQSYRSCFHFL